MENKTPEEWKRLKDEKQLAILKGQSMNQAWNFVINNIERSATEQEIITEYMKLYNKLLQVNLKLLNGGK